QSNQPRECLPDRLRREKTNSIFDRRRLICRSPTLITKRVRITLTRSRVGRSLWTKHHLRSVGLGLRLSPGGTVEYRFRILSGPLLPRLQFLLCKACISYNDGK